VVFHRHGACGLEPHTDRTLEQRPTAVDHDGIGLRQTRARFPQRPRRQQPAVAESAVSIDDDHFAVTRQRVMLQSIVAHNHVAAGTHQELRRSRSIAADGNRHAGAARQ